MKKTGLFVVLLALGCVVLPHRSPAPIIVREGETTYVAPGSEEVPNQKDAQTQFDTAFAKEKAGDNKSALGGYHKTVRRFPKSDAAPSAQYRAGLLYEKLSSLPAAAAEYENLVKKYPRSNDFNNALEGEYRIATAYLEGAKTKLLGVVPVAQSMPTSIRYYSFIIANAPYSRFAPLSQFNIGQALEREQNLKDAVIAYQAVVDKYPTDPAASDALYQIGFVEMEISRSGSYDRNAAVRAKESFDDFLAAYPTSEKAAQARENLTSLNVQQTGGSLQIARYYDKQRKYKAAIIYYNDVIRQQPSSPEGNQAKQRLDALRVKLGDTAFNQATSTAPVTPANGANKPATPTSGDSRLQAQAETSKRPDYVGPPVSAPTPPPVVAPPVVDSGTAPSTGSAPASSQTEPKPPPVPEGDQPALPSQ